MQEITSIAQIEAMEDEEINERMEEICSRYVEVIDSIFVPGIPGFTPASVIHAKSDLTALSEVKDLPPFALELIIHFLFELNNGFEGTVQEKYHLKYYDVFLAVARSTLATGDLLHEIAEEMSYLSDESLEINEIQYDVAMAVLSNEHCLPKTFSRLVGFAFYCRNNRFNCEGEDAITLIVENPKTPIETLQKIRAEQIERFGEQPEPDTDEDEEVDIGDESVVQAINRVLKERAEEIKRIEASQYYDDPSQLKLFELL